VPIRIRINIGQRYEYGSKLKNSVGGLAGKIDQGPDTLRAGSKNTNTSRFQFFPEQSIFQPDLKIHFSPGPCREGYDLDDASFQSDKSF
jgi:hypothetical protein